MKPLLSNHEGQATTEYILMLITAVSFFMLLYSKLLSPVVNQLGTTIAQKVQSTFFSGDFHSLNIGH